MHGDPVGLSAGRSVGFPNWTVLIGRKGFDTICSIPDPTLILKGGHIESTQISPLHQLTTNTSDVPPPRESIRTRLMEIFEIANVRSSETQSPARIRA